MVGDKGHVVYFNIVPSKELDDLRLSLASRLGKIVCSCKSWDEPGTNASKFKYHITLSFRLSDGETGRVMSRLNNPPRSHLGSAPLGKLLLPLDSLRLTLLGNDSRILCEYDMTRKKVLNRRESLSKKSWAATMKAYRLNMGFEITKRLQSRRPRIFVVSDTHFGHENIIRYCARPFTSNEEMNSVLVKNWNNTVGPKDTVYFLGDMSFGRDSRPAGYWAKKLNGNIVFVPGNHDRGFEDAEKYHILEHGNTKFLLVHDPNKLPIEWDGWVIHGDKHNNDLRNYPFVNWEKKTVNVSSEVIGYKPIDFEDILKSIGKKKNIMDFI